MQYLLTLILLLYCFAILSHSQTLDRTLNTEDEWKIYLNSSPEHSESEDNPLKEVDHVSNIEIDKKKAIRKERYKKEKARFDALPPEHKEFKRARKRLRQRSYCQKNKEEYGFPSKHAALIDQARSSKKAGNASDKQLEIIKKAKEYHQKYYRKQKSQGVKKYFSTGKKTAN